MTTTVFNSHLGPLKSSLLDAHEIVKQVQHNPNAPLSGEQLGDLELSLNNVDKALEELSEALQAELEDRPAPKAKEAAPREKAPGAEAKARIKAPAKIVKAAKAPKPLPKPLPKHATKNPRHSAKLRRGASPGYARH